MADLGEEFDGETVDTSSVDLLPKGKYAAHIVEFDTSENDGDRRIELTFEIIEGPFEHRRAWANYTYSGGTEKGLNFGRIQIAKLQGALGIGPFRNTAELEQKPLTITIGIKEGDNGYKDRNVINGFAPYTNAAPPARAENRRPADNSTGRTTYNGGSAPARQAPPARANSPTQATGARRAPWPGRGVPAEQDAAN